MKRIGKPTGLIRYASENKIALGEKLRFTPRIIGYIVLLTIVVSFLTYLMVNRTETETTILRTPGMLYQEMEAGKVSNLYNVKIVNKTRKDIPISIELESPKGTVKLVGNESMTVKNHASVEGIFFVYIDKKDIKYEKTPIVFKIISKNKVVETVSSTFVGPTK